MFLNRERFNRHVAKMGQQVQWRSAFACSCVNPASGAPDPKCKLCGKKGRIWNPPLDTICAPQKQDVQAEWANSGLWEAGDLVVTIPENSPMWDSGQFDRVTMRNSTDRFSLPLTRGAVNENLSVYVVKSVERVFWKHPQTQALIEGGLPEWDEAGNLVWSGPGQPPMGTTYSITGWRYSDYFVFGDFPSNRNMHSGVRLPKRVVLRRWDLMPRG